MQVNYCLVFLLNALLFIIMILGDFIHFHVKRSEETALGTLRCHLLLLLLSLNLFLECIVKSEHFRKLAARCNLCILSGRHKHLPGLLFGLGVVLLVSLLALFHTYLLFLLPLKEVTSLLLLCFLLFYLTQGPIEDTLLV